MPPINNIPRTVETIDADTDTYSSSVESEEDRVYLQIGTNLRGHLDRDWALINQHGKLPALPGSMPAVTILENWVKHYSIKACTVGFSQQLRHEVRRSSSAKAEKREKEYERLVRSIALRKEVADGIRIYLNYTIRDYLLYAPEREQAAWFMSPEFGASFEYAAPERQSLDLLTANRAEVVVEEGGGGGGGAGSNGAGGVDVRDAVAGGALSAEVEPTKRRLRSHKNDESEYILDIGLSGPKVGDKSR